MYFKNVTDLVVGLFPHSAYQSITRANRLIPYFVSVWMPRYYSKSGQSPFLLLNLLLSAADCPFSTWSILFFVTALGLLGIKFLILVTSQACSFREIYFLLKFVRFPAYVRARVHTYSALCPDWTWQRVLGVCTFHYDSHCDQDH